MSIKVERMRNACSKIITLNIVFNTNNFFHNFSIPWDTPWIFFQFAFLKISSRNSPRHRKLQDLFCLWISASMRLHLRSSKEWQTDKYVHCTLISLIFVWWNIWKGKFHLIFEPQQKGGKSNNSENERSATLERCLVAI